MTVEVFALKARNVIAQDSALGLVVNNKLLRPVPLKREAYRSTIQYETEEP